MTMVGSGAYGSVRSASSPCWVRAPVAKDPARQQVDDLEQHPASQPSRRPACWRSGRSATRSSIRAAHDRPGDRSPPMICTAARRFRPGTRPRWPRPALPLPPSRTSGGGCPSCARPAPPASSCATHPSEVRGSGPGADAPAPASERAVLPQEQATSACSASPETPLAIPRGAFHARTVSCAMSRTSFGVAR